jgi:hypothetical protein
MHPIIIMAVQLLVTAGVSRERLIEGERGAYAYTRQILTAKVVAMDQVGDLKLAFGDIWPCCLHIISYHRSL